MTVTTPALAGAPVHRATFWNALRSEWTKFRTLRSGMYTLLGAVVLTIALNMMVSNTIGQTYPTLSAEELAEFDPTAQSLRMGLVGQIIVGILGALVITSEYANGAIRTSMSTVPRRGWLLAAKTMVMAVVGLAVGEVIAFGSFLPGQAIIASHTGVPHATLSQPGVLRAVMGGGLYLAVVALLGVAMGVLFRATAGALASLVFILLLVRILSGGLPAPWPARVEKYWPTMAGEKIAAVVQDPSNLAPWTGFALLCGAVAVLLAIGSVVFHRRDA